jgi:selenocysteine lyase/cysteine desulfurase
VAAGALAAPLLARAEALEAALDTTLSAVKVGGGAGVDVQALKAQYLLSDELTYLNHASIGTVPRVVHEAHVAHLELCEAHPSLYVWGRVWRDVTEVTRRAAADLLRCVPDDLAITHSTTEGFNILAAGLPLGPGDEVLFSTLNHPGASVPWERMAAERGFTVRRFDFPLRDAPSLDDETVVGIHSAALSPATRVLVFPHVDNMVGLRHPMAALTTMAREAGVEFVAVDGAQSAGMIPVDLAASGVDAYAMSPHKWVQSPKGLGLFYARAGVRERIRPLWVRSGMSLGTTARRFEDYSTRAWPAVVALGDALAFQASLGETEKDRRYRALRDRVLQRVEASRGLAWRSPRRWQSGSVIMAVEVLGREAPALGRTLLEDHGVVVRAFGPPLNTLRISPNVGTSHEELDAALELLEGG